MTKSGFSVRYLKARKCYLSVNFLVVEELRRNDTTTEEKFSIFKFQFLVFSSKFPETNARLQRCYKLKNTWAQLYILIAISGILSLIIFL